MLSPTREYRVNNVTYIVSGRYEPILSRNTLCSRIEDIISGEMVDLMNMQTEDKMETEYVYSAADKEV